MCVNYTPTRNEVWLREHFDLALPAALAAVGEVYPAGATPLIRRAAGGGFECVSASFGLIPGWARDRSIARHTCNARSETAAVKPSFREAWRRNRIGVVAMDGFFEPDYANGRAERWRIARRDGQPFAVACLWDSWQDPASGRAETSVSLLTVDASTHELLRRFHRPHEEKRSVVPLVDTALAQWWEAPAASRQACLALPATGLLIAAPDPRPAASKRQPARAGRRAEATATPPSGDQQGSLF